MLARSIIASACLLAGAAIAAPMPQDLAADSLSSDVIVASQSTRYKPSFVVFGDSLSDNGSMPHYSNYSHYWGDRYSNSYMWNEYTAKLLNMNLENHAIGGSTTDNNFSPAWGRNGLIPSISQVIQQYIANNTKTPIYKKRSAIVAFDGGANDVFYAIDGLLSGSINTAQWAQQLASIQIASINRLLDAGYRNIYVINLPDMSKAPSASQYGGAAFFSSIMNAYNQQLKQSVADLVKSRPGFAHGVQIYDFTALMSQSLQPTVLQAINVTDTTNSCLSYSSTGSLIYCPSPDTGYFYDEFHPSGRPHYLIGVHFANTIWNQDADTSTGALIDLAKKYDIAHSDSTHNIIASSS
ncbi:hypothetical protein GGI12_002954 [Dipsacomyces acuminosporus]|nr:hypothetical protein GGI12_002954 [Dipsacomyces acuminosporus]